MTAKHLWIDWMDRGAILSNCLIVYEPAVHPINPWMLCGPNANPVLSSFRTWPYFLAILAFSEIAFIIRAFNSSSQTSYEKWEKAAILNHALDFIPQTLSIT